MLWVRKMVFACDNCHYLFSRVKEPEQCPDCGKYRVRPAREDEQREFEAQISDNNGLIINEPKAKENTGRQAQGRKLITLFKSFLNAERPRDVYVTASESPYQTHCRRIAKDDNDLLQYFML